MARERMVTRTITNTTYKIMCVDTTNCEVTIEQFNATDDFNYDEKALKYFRKLHETDTKKLVKIESVETIEQLYGMTELEFLQYAKLLPARGTKAVKENE